MNKNGIHVYQIPSNKNVGDKLLLKILNDNDEDFTNISVELLAIYVNPLDQLVKLDIKSDKQYFSTGLKESGNIIWGNRSAELEIIENSDGIMRILLDDIAEYDILSGKPENKKFETYSLVIKINGKLDGRKFVSYPYLLTFDHYINDLVTIQTGNNEPKFSSGILWDKPNKEVNLLKEKEILDSIK